MDDIDMATMTIEQEIERQIIAVRMKNRSAESALECEDFGGRIPQKRRLAVPGCVRCVRCQEEYENS